MPLTIDHITEKNGRLGVWQLTESEAFFLEKLTLSAAQKKEIEPLKGLRKLDWLASRHLIGQITEGSFLLEKDQFGKPHLVNSELHLSLSHTRNWSAVIVSPHSVGIDIQQITPKLEPMAWRVMNDEKFKILDPNNRLEHLHVYWGAKEALYKAWGKRDLHFKQNIIVKPFDYAVFAANQHEIQKITEGVVLKENYEQRYDIYFSKIENTILVYALESIQPSAFS